MSQPTFPSNDNKDSIICFDGIFNKIMANVFDDGPVIICFDPLFIALDRESLPFGLSFFEKAKRNVISVKSFQNDWYQSEEFEAALDVIDKVAGHRSRIGYGSSMGAYAAVNFAKRLRMSYSICFSPQATIDPSKAAFEFRYAMHSKGLTFRNDDLSSGYEAQGLLFYDPYEHPDEHHADMITAEHPFTQIKVPYFGHQTISAFGEGGVLGAMLLNIIDKKTEWHGLIKIRRSIRTRVPLYFINMAHRALRRGRYQLAKNLAQRAEALNASPAATGHIIAIVCFLEGHVGEAIVRWQKLIADDANRDYVWHLIGTSALSLNIPDLQHAFWAKDVAFASILPSNRSQHAETITKL